jgi:hypothetical protein
MKKSDRYWFEKKLLPEDFFSPRKLKTKHGHKEYERDITGENHLTRHGRAGNVPSYIDLSTAFCHPFCDSKNLVGHMLVHVIFPAVGADLGGDIFHNKGHPIPIKGNGCRTFSGLAVFADDALHDILRE